MSSLYADIHKRIGNFELDILIKSDAPRIGILGASGSGKSMSLRSIAGIEDVDSGRIDLGGRVLYDSASGINLKPQKRNVGYMFQNYALFPTMSVMKNVLAGLKGGATDKNKAKACDMLARFNMSAYENHLPGELSGGQQQRVALARIMVTEPELILLDEPFSALDGYLRERMQAEMLEMIEDYQGQIVMVSHSVDELLNFSEELVVISQGKVIRQGRCEDVINDPGSEEASLLTGRYKDVKNIQDAKDFKDLEEGDAMSDFTHFDDKGNARMVDVSDKDITKRTAIAEGSIRLSREAMDAVLGKKIKKGDVLTVAQVAGIMGSKRTSEFIPMCHPLELTNAAVEFDIDEAASLITARCTASIEARTGVEMEALTGVSVTLLTIYDMCKAIDKNMAIENIHLVLKSGGKSGDYDYER